MEALQRFDAKLIVVGEMAVGKSCIIEKYVKGRFNEHKEGSIGVGLSVKEVQFAEGDLQLRIWDTAGQDTYQTIVKTYF